MFPSKDARNAQDAATRSLETSKLGAWRSDWMSRQGLLNSREGRPTLKGVSVAVCVVLACGLTGCDVVHDEHLDGTYRLVAIDTIESMSVCRRLKDAWCVGDEMPGPTVFAAGASARYVVIARHPNEQGRADFDRSVTEYYNVVRPPESAYLKDTDVVGPMDGQAFAAARARLGLPGFSRVIDELK
jgi:hypothetical protein